MPAVQGAQRLRDRLTRRGVTATALTVAMATAADAATAVSPRWAEAAVAAATGSASTATALALSQTILRAMLVTRLKAAAIALLAAAGIVSAGVVVNTTAPDDGKPEMKARDIPKPLVTTADKPVPATTQSAMIDVRGRVVDPDGKPVTGATVRTAYLDREITPAPEVASGPDGRFDMRLPQWRRNSVLRRRDAMFPWVVASAPGFGPGWASAIAEPGASGKVAIRLVADGPPIEGRIVDLEGRPIAGVAVRVERLWFDREGKLSDWLAQAAQYGAEGPWRGLENLPVTIKATTDVDGRFRIAGIGRDRMAELIVSGPTITTAQLYAVNRDGEAIRTVTTWTMAPEKTVYHARRFEYAAAPTKPIEGVVRDKDTGRPIAGLTFEGMVYNKSSHVTAPGLETTTDARGHYRLTGLPKAPAYQLFLNPGKGSPYTKTTFRVPAETQGLDPVKFDVALKRGVLVRGRVTDKASGKPVPGYVNAYTVGDNPHAEGYPGYASSYAPFVYLDDDGRYEIVTLPGRGIIACRSDLGLYRGYVGADAFKGYDAENGLIGAAQRMHGPQFPRARRG